MNIFQKIKQAFHHKEYSIIDSDEQIDHTYYTKSCKTVPYKSRLGEGKRIQFMICDKNDAYFKIITNKKYVEIENLFNKDEQIIRIPQPYSLAFRY